MVDAGLSDLINRRVQEIAQRRQAKAELRPPPVGKIQPLTRPVKAKAYLRSVKNPGDDYLVIPRNPSDYNENMDVVYEDVIVPGLSGALHPFTAGGAAKIPFNFEIIDYRCTAPGAGPTTNVIEGAVSWIKRHMMPTVQDTRLVAIPDMLQLEIGQRIESVRIKTYNMNITKFWPDMRPRRAKISLDLIVILDKGHRNPSYYASRF